MLNFQSEADPQRGGIVTTPTLTVEQAIGQLRLTDEQLRIWRKVTLVLGFRNVGKALSAIAPRKGAATGTVAPQVADSESLEARLATMVIIDQGPLRLPSVPRKRSSWDYRPMTMARAVKMIPTVYTPAIVAAIRKWHVEHPYNPAKWPFCSSMAKGKGYAVDITDATLAKYEAKECCGATMGIMESWDKTVSAVYQCAVNPKHTKPAMPKTPASIRTKKAKKAWDQYRGTALAAS